MLQGRVIKYCVSFVLLMSTAFIIAETKPITGFNLVAQKWYLNPDGEWIAIVEAHNAPGRVDYRASGGEVFDLPVWAFDNLHTIKIVTKTPMPLTVTAQSGGEVRTVNLPMPSVQYPSPLQLTVRAVGPHLVTLGFAWLGTTPIDQYEIWGRRKHSTEKLIGFLTSNSTTFQDDGVRADTVYSYRVVARRNNQSIKQVELSVKTPPVMATKTLQALRGKGVIIYIDPLDTRSDFYFKKLPPEKIVADCLKLGLRYIQLRTVYGTYSHFRDKEIVNWLTNLLEQAGKNDLYLLAWSIPRRDETDAIAEDIVVSSLKSPSGYTFAGCSLDLETGTDYMGSLAQAKEKIGHYARTFRRAVGPNYLISSIVFTPWQTGYTNENYPYRELAESTDVLQPMVFWHHYFESAHHFYSQAEVTEDIAGAVYMIKQLAGKDIPVNVIGQSIDLGNTGLPTSLEISDALQAANAARAIGVSFFAWNKYILPDDGGPSALAQAIQNYQW